MGGERGQADLVVGALELAWGYRQRLSQRPQGQWLAVAALDGHLCADVELGHELNGDLAMGGAVGHTTPSGHTVLVRLADRFGTRVPTGLIDRSVTKPPTRGVQRSPPGGAKSTVEIYDAVV